MNYTYSLLNSQGRVALSSNGQLFAHQLGNVIYVREATQEAPVRVAFQIPPSKQEVRISFSFCGNYLLYYALPTDVEVNIFRLGPENNHGPHLDNTGSERILPYSPLSDKQMCIQINELGIRYAAFSPNLNLFCVTDNTSEVLEIRFLSAWNKQERSLSKSVRFATDTPPSHSTAISGASPKEDVLLRAIPGAKKPFLFSAELSHVAFVMNSYHQDKLHIIGTGEQLNSVVDFSDDTFDASYLEVLGPKVYLIIDLHSVTLYKVQLLAKNEASVVRYESRAYYQFNSTTNKSLSLYISAVGIRDVHIVLAYANSQATLLSKNLQERMVLTGLPGLLEACENLFVECRCKEVVLDNQRNGNEPGLQDSQNFCTCGIKSLSRPVGKEVNPFGQGNLQLETDELLVYQEIVSFTDDDSEETSPNTGKERAKHGLKQGIHSEGICSTCGLRIASDETPGLSENQRYDFASLNPQSYLIKTTLDHLDAQYSSQNATFQLPRLLGAEAYLKRNIRSGYMSKVRFSSCCRFFAYVGVQYPTTLIIVDPLEMKLVAILVFYDIIVDFLFTQSNLYVLTSSVVQEYKDYDFCSQLDQFSTTCSDMRYERSLRPVVVHAAGSKHLLDVAANRMFKWSPRHPPHYVPLPHDVANVKLNGMHLAYNDILIISTESGIAVVSTT